LTQWWRERRERAQRRKALRDALPVGYEFLLFEVFVLLGRSFAGFNGIGMAISISVMGSSYTSLTSVNIDHICLASQFVSRTIQGGRTAAWQFFVGGLLAIVAAATPRAVWGWRNAKEGTQPLPFSEWASGLSVTTVRLLFVFFQLTPLFVSFTLFLKGIGHAFGLQLSPEAIQSMWHQFQLACGHQ
jgi:hypothetical protein